ncbi:hypothetical protein AVEN_111590-1 [Araneus ventricosus]|uniref:Uncharacterized protein n=1 Tax=Araneus ventricosus TaxID=182803 RepID=A0A4Y2VS61_ARAVE|nr:hypothetical protein AVEN_120966-1 [Araneus ventricosus]GBO28269.1 hypothetical protein AVEN_111590-1 [Araneus ventricosus]
MTSTAPRHKSWIRHCICKINSLHRNIDATAQRILEIMSFYFLKIPIKLKVCGVFLTFSHYLYNTVGSVPDTFPESSTGPTHTLRSSAIAQSFLRFRLRLSIALAFLTENKPQKNSPEGLRQTISRTLLLSPTKRIWRRTESKIFLSGPPSRNGPRNRCLYLKRFVGKAPDT